MPLGIERINPKRNQPNDHIVFIKPLPGPDEATALDFLERIAAVCKPIMKANHLAVMSLAEHEPNREFLGRNFNAGELIELVLKSHSGRWLPFSFVQMIMMHELAHCKEMNHSGAFWKVRNQFAAELRGLWSRGYSGDGFWSRGQKLYDGQYTMDSMPASSNISEHLCGGTYRSRRNKRKRKLGTNGKEKSQLSYVERKQRWIAKKFGAGGVTLGDDEDEREKLEKGKISTGKPRVAGSARGRELRAAAALARFEKAKREDTKEEEFSDTDSEYDSPATIQEAVDVAGQKMLDSQGQGMVKVCGAEDSSSDVDARRELEEMQLLQLNSTHRRRNQSYAGEIACEDINEEHMLTAREDDKIARSPSTTSYSMRATLYQESATAPDMPTSSASPTTTTIAAANNSITSNEVTGSVCTVCSLNNHTEALTCSACANVLNTQALPNHWRCRDAACVSNVYINSGDSGVCGICGAQRHLPTT